jgi:isopentenyl diphosphate isomerase/L-lactate dehydrogenase-like FMN-dependent dehydrogenase
MSDRREFLKFLAGSPLLASMPAVRRTLMQNSAAQTDSVIASAADAINVFDFEAAARKALPPAHWGYMASGVDSDGTLQANRDAFSHYQLRTRVFVDVSKIDMSTELFGTRYDIPIVLAPVGSQRAFHPQGEVAAAKAAASKKALQILSTQSSIGVEDVIAARNAPIWYQLYTTNSWDVTQKLVKRAEKAGCPVVAVTLDLPNGRNTETMSRFQKLDTRVCANCHNDANGGNADPTRGSVKPMFTGINMDGITVTSPSLTWDFIKRLKDVTTMKVVLKGVQTREDAALAVKNGADGIIVSNHGGRSAETLRGTIDCLPEVIQGAGGRIPVIVDSGFRRGTDIFKALAMGARAVAIGRPYIWGLSAFGQAGVEKVVEILTRELTLVMGQCGARSLKEITPGSIIDIRRA